MKRQHHPCAIDLGAPDVPEDCLSIPGQGIPINLINTCLIRADATLNAVMVDGGRSDGFTLNDHEIVNILWGVSGWIQMARKALNPPVKIEGKP